MNTPTTAATAATTTAFTSTLPAGAIAIFAKCPIPGSSKTRLSVIVGDDGSATLARAMLSDIILDISSSSSSDSNESKKLDNIMKFLVYGPGDECGERIMKDLLSDLNLEFVSLANNNFDDNNSDDDKLLENALNKQHLTYDHNKWYLLPMQTPKKSSSKSINHDEKRSSQERNAMDDLIKKNLRSSDLGSKLQNVLIRIRTIGQNCFRQTSNHDHETIPILVQPSTTTTTTTTSNLGDCSINFDLPILFLGMDSPEIPTHEIIQAIKIAKSNNDDHCSEDSDKIKQQLGKAYLNPAHDGGYGMLCVPSHAPPSVFQGVRWSASLTAVSQLKALTDNGIDVVLGSLMNDIDEPDDLMNLAVRLCLHYSSSASLSSPSPQTGQGFETLNKDIYVDRLSHSSEVIRLDDDHDDNNGGENQDQHTNVKKSLCPHTFRALIDLDLVQKKERNSGIRYIVSLNRFQLDEQEI